MIFLHILVGLFSGLWPNGAGCIKPLWIIP